MHQLIADKQEEIAVICLRHRVERLEVFGSAARGTDFAPPPEKRHRFPGGLPKTPAIRFPGPLVAVE